MHTTSSHVFLLRHNQSMTSVRHAYKDVTGARLSVVEAGDVGAPIVMLVHGFPESAYSWRHQMLALALGAKTRKMSHGHHGANHPVKDLLSGKVEITSMNHGFTVDTATLPEGVIETHVSLFDGTNCGIAVKGKPVYSVQHHPEASPGPQDSFYLFERFAEAMKARRAA